MFTGLQRCKCIILLLHLFAINKIITSSEIFYRGNTDVRASISPKNLPYKIYPSFPNIIDKNVFNLKVTSTKN